ncbi:hypothetical protein M422DRAFT_45659 [Sphaerobolus stellatus SS14]|nr:hypothetical protein M422DRAFT_45659 [Sphaerobolus stellatus SS14]
MENLRRSPSSGDPTTCEQDEPVSQELGSDSYPGERGSQSITGETQWVESLLPFSSPGDPAKRKHDETPHVPPMTAPHTPIPRIRRKVGRSLEEIQAGLEESRRDVRRQEQELVDAVQEQHRLISELQSTGVESSPVVFKFGPLEDSPGYGWGRHSAEADDRFSRYLSRGGKGLDSDRSWEEPQEGMIGSEGKLVPFAQLEGA